MVVGGWIDGFRTIAAEVGWTQAIVILVLIALMFTGLVVNRVTKRRSDDNVYGHRVDWRE